MKIVYDNIVFDIQRCGGISVVWQELLSRISNQQVSVSYIDNKNQSNYSRKKLEIPSTSVIKRIRYPRLTRYLPVSLQCSEPFIFHSSYYRYCANPLAINITTVHDFTYELFVKGLKQKVHTWQKFSAIRHSDVVVCVSENTKRDLLRLMPDVDEPKVKVIYNGVSDSFRVLDNDTGRDELPFAPRSYVVFIGRRDSYKNFEMVTKNVAASKYNLLIIGAQLNENERIAVEQILSPTRYKCMSYVPDDKLNVLYNHAAALTYPSSYEGFGLPVLEAQRAGCPVIALNTSSIPEVIGSTPLLMQELTDKEFTDKLNILDNKELMRQVSAEGLTNSQNFSWEKMADEYATVYSELLGG